MTRFWSHLATPEEKKRRSTRQNPKQQTKSNEMQSATVQLLQLGSEKETVINSHNKRSASTTENSIQTASSTDTGKRARTTI